MHIATYKALNDLEASLSILSATISLFHSGNDHAYRVISVELRKLVCDGRDGENALVRRLFPEIKLHPITRASEEIREKLLAEQLGVALEDLVTFRLPSMIYFDGKGGSKIERLFYLDEPPIDLTAWLDQPLFNKKITIRELIKSVADKEGAHSDKNYNDTLRAVMSVKLPDQDIHLKHIVAIGEYLLNTLHPMYETLLRDMASK
jgi:hypothetical protein